VQDRLFRALLSLLPREFRDAYARDMAATFRRERIDASSRRGLLGLWLATIADVLRVAPAHHWDILTRDLRGSWRALASRPLHTATATITLALGIGASVGIFAVIDAVWLKPLPYRASDELVAIRETADGGAPGTLGYATFADLRAGAQTIAAMAAATQSIATLSGDGRDPERVSAMRASANYLEMIGVAPALGRWFVDAEDRPGEARRVIVLADSLWRRRFGADPAVIQRVIKVSGADFRVVGVMPPGFNDLVAGRLYQQAEMWTPLGYDPAASFACRTCRHLRVFARLAPGRTAAEAQRDLSAILARVAEAHPTSYHRAGIDVITLGDLFFGPVRQTLAVLSVGVALLLLVACGNVANLLLLRATERAHDVAVRTALGVTTGRLIRQHVTEATLLSVIAAALGVPLAYLVVQLFIGAGASSLPRLEEAALDGRAIAAAVGVVLACGAAFGGLAVAHLRKQTPGSALHGAGRRTASAGTWRARSFLVAANMAMAAVLLVGSGLFVRSLQALLAVDLGFDARPVLTTNVSLSGPRYAGDPDAIMSATLDFYDRVLDRIRALPGVAAAAGTTNLPLTGIDEYGLHVVGRPLANPQSAPSAQRFVVTPGYFDVMRIPLVRGRLLTSADGRRAPAVAIINATLAAGVFPGEDPIGRQIALGPPTAPPRTIVGIAGDVRHRGLDAPLTYEVYVPQAQWAWAETGMALVVRSAGAPLAPAAGVRQAIREVDATLPVGAMRAYTDIVDATIAARRVTAQLVSLFAGVAFGLATVGLYGALGVAARQRQQEIGVRLALGAQAREIAGLVLRQGLRPAFVGLAAGLLVAAVAVPGISALLYGITGVDPLTFAGAAATLALSAVLACALPALRAARTNALAALRSD
jgi:putative ABC transport system permease protein